MSFQIDFLGRLIRKLLSVDIYNNEDHSGSDCIIQPVEGFLSGSKRPALEGYPEGWKPVELRINSKYADFIIELCAQSAHYIQVAGEIAGENAMVRGTSICTRSAV